MLDLEPEDLKEERIPVTSVHPVSQLGDVWLLGQHKIYCGDALDTESYSMLMEGNKASLIFTDPPYNLKPRDIGKVCKQEHGSFKEASGEMSQEEFTEFLSRVFESLVKVSHKGSIHYICMDWRHINEILEAGSKHYQELKNICVWAKDKAGMGSFYRSQHELVLVFKHGDSKHQNNFQLGQFGRNRSNVWEYPTARHLVEGNGDASGKEILKLHPTIKPVQMVEDALLDCSQQNEIVLDPFLGSGTTLIAAEKTNRIGYGIEYEPRYVDVAIERWQDWTGKDAVHAETELTFKQTQDLTDVKEVSNG